MDGVQVSSNWPVLTAQINPLRAHNPRVRLARISKTKIAIIRKLAPKLDRGLGSSVLVQQCVKGEIGGRPNWSRPRQRTPPMQNSAA